MATLNKINKRYILVQVLILTILALLGVGMMVLAATNL